MRRASLSALLCTMLLAIVTLHTFFADAEQPVTRPYRDDMAVTAVEKATLDSLKALKASITDSLRAGRLIATDSLNVPWVFVTDSLGVPRLIATDSINAPYVVVTDSLKVPLLVVSDSLKVPWLECTDSINVPVVIVSDSLYCLIFVAPDVIASDSLYGLKVVGGGSVKAPDILASDSLYGLRVVAGDSVKAPWFRAADSIGVAANLSLTRKGVRSDSLIDLTSFSGQSEIAVGNTGDTVLIYGLTAASICDAMPMAQPTGSWWVQMKTGDAAHPGTLFVKSNMAQATTTQYCYSCFK